MVDLGFAGGPAAAGMLVWSQNPAQQLFDQLHQLDLGPMTVVLCTVGSVPASS